MKSSSEHSCQAVQEMASAFVDGGLGLEETTVLQEHLRGCADCRKFMGNISRVRDFLLVEESRGPMEAVSPDFAASVSRRLSGERIFVPAPSRSIRPAGGLWRRLSGAAAAAALLLSVAWTWNRISTTEDPFPAVATAPVQQELEEGSVASYLREHTLQAMDATFLGAPEGVELASFEFSGQSFE